MKKIIILFKVMFFVCSLNAQEVLIDATINCSDDIWTSETNNWDWDQGPNAPANVFKPGNSIIMKFEHLVDKVYAPYSGDSMTVMCGWFKMAHANGDDVWDFYDTEIFNMSFPTIMASDWGGSSYLDYTINFPTDMITTSSAKVSYTTSDTPDADFYMLQIKSYKNGVLFSQEKININFMINIPICKGCGEDYSNNGCTISNTSEILVDTKDIVPNPVAKGDMVCVNGIVNVYNTNGVYLFSAEHVINTAELSRGIYIIRSQDSNLRTSSSKLIVE